MEPESERLKTPRSPRQAEMLLVKRPEGARIRSFPFYILQHRSLLFQVYSRTQIRGKQNPLGPGWGRAPQLCFLSSNRATKPVRGGPRRWRLWNSYATLNFLWRLSQLGCPPHGGGGQTRGTASRPAFCWQLLQTTCAPAILVQPSSIRRLGGAGSISPSPLCAPTLGCAPKSPALGQLVAPGTPRRGGRDRQAERSWAPEGPTLSFLHWKRGPRGLQAEAPKGELRHKQGPG